jgi:hypothetical protein
MQRGHGRKRKSPGGKPGDVEGGEERKAVCVFLVLSCRFI